MTLSKSLYTRAIQCPKSLWLKKYNPDVLEQPDESASSVFETGNIVGDLACELFPNGKEVVYSKNYDEMMAQTKQYLDDGISAIYEATFKYHDILVMVDVLIIEDDGSFSIYEVKSSTSVKDIYLHDASIQYFVLKGLGHTIKRTNIIHIDTSYIRGDELELDELFSIVDVSDEVISLQDDIPTRLKEFEEYLEDKINEPNIDIGPYCKKPYECDAKDYCWKVQWNIPEYSIFNIFNLGSKKQIELYNQGIIKIDDIADDFDMTAIQKQKVLNYKSKQTYINKEKIQEFIDTLTYPIYHLDFETFQQAVPEFKGISPFEQIPFQYSLHIEYEDGRLEHKEFLAKCGINPRYELAKSLVQDIPQDVTVLAYNMSFEKGIIKKLSQAYEQFSIHLLNINENIKDLMYVFQKKYYVTPSMNGSYSIKYVLPALVPALAKAYKNLDGIQNGSQAMNAYPKLITMNKTEKQNIQKALLEYCKLDTLAMVEVLNKLKEVLDE